MIGNRDFIDDIKQYILNELSQDTNFSNTNVANAYDSENTLKTPQISVYISSDREDEASNSYDSENISILRVIFYCYNKAMVFNEDDEKTSAIESTMLLSDKLKEILNKNNLVSNNSNIISSIRKSYTQPQSLRDSNVYVDITTYQFKVLNNYTKIYNQNTNEGE